MKCPNEIIKKMKKMEVRINKYEKNYNDKNPVVGRVLLKSTAVPVLGILLNNTN